METIKKPKSLKPKLTLLNKSAEIISPDFGMMGQPLDLQLTVHINNYLATFGTQGSIQVWKDVLENPAKLNDESVPLMVRQVVRHYGEKNVKQWFGMVYHWNFTSKKSVNKKLVNKAG